jgi:hypothetical protein
MTEANAISVNSPEKTDLRSVRGFPRNTMLPVTLFENIPLAKEKEATGIKNDQQKKVINGTV